MKEVFIIYHIPNHCGHHIVERVTDDSNKVEQLIKEVQEQYGNFTSVEVKELE